MAAVFSLADVNRRVCSSVTALDVKDRHRNRNGQTVLKCYSSLCGTNVLSNGCSTHDEADMENWSKHQYTNPVNHDIP